MARNRKIHIPQGFACNECGSINLIGVGTQFKKNPDGNNPRRVLFQRLQCKDCGKIVLDGKVDEEA